MNDLVLGGKGFIGRSLAALLRSRGNAVRSLDRSNGENLEHAEQFEEAFRWADRVWFLAWHVPAWKNHTSPEEQIEALKRSMGLCESVFAVLEKTKKPFLFTTSQITASQNVGSHTPYRVSKAVGEIYAKNLGGLTAKFWNVYGWEGIGEKSHVVTDLVYQALINKKIVCGTNGDELRQFLYVSDCAEGLLRQFEGEQPYADITSWQWTPLREVVRIISEQCRVPFMLGDKEGPPPFSEPSVKCLGWQPKISLEQGLQMAIAIAKGSLSSKEH